jgi:anaerobic selenocysteine-containing dehydrogenase
MAVHEQFMTETAAMADIVLPATMFMEHDDLYYGGGHQHISVGAKLIDPPGECRSNHEVLQGLGRRLNAVHPGFEMSARGLIDATLKKSGHGDIETLEADLWRDLQPDFRTAHYLDGFGHADGKFHFKADWAHPPFGKRMGEFEKMPSLPDHWTIIEEADEAHPFRLATSPSRSFLNTSFNETPSSQAREGAPSVMIHPADAARLSIADGDAVILGNTRGETTLTARLFDGLRRGVLIAESVHPNKAHIGGRGINTLTGAEAVAPIGGAAFHDNRVWMKKATAAAAPPT